MAGLVNWADALWPRLFGRPWWRLRRRLLLLLLVLINGVFYFFIRSGVSEPLLTPAEVRVREQVAQFAGPGASWTGGSDGSSAVSADVLVFGGYAVRSSFATPEALLAALPSEINLCHPSWSGIREATYGQGLPVLEVPGILSPEHARLLLDVLVQLPLRRLVVNGIPPNSVEFAHVLKAQMPTVEVLFVYHGSPGQGFHFGEASLLAQLIAATRSGVVSRLGLVKNDMHRSFTEGLGVSTYEIWNQPPILYRLRDASHSVHRRVWRIGVLAISFVSHKNVLAQVLALCRLDNVEIHVLEKPQIAYLSYCRAPIVEHGGSLEHDAFMKVVTAMDLVLYVSLTECFPMTVIESISAGVPAITSPTSAIYSLDPVLADFLVVSELDSPDRIADQVERVMAHYDTVSLRVWDLVPVLRAKADRQWRMFMENLPERALPPVGGLDYQIPRAPEPVVPAGERLPTVVFVTYEAYPATLYAGGAGVVINGIVVELLRRGHNVIVLADFDANLVSDYRRFHAEPAQAKEYRGRLSVHHVDDILASGSCAPPESASPPPGCPRASQSIFVAKSRRFATALRLLYAQTPFDLVECFDYAGVAHELLHVRSDPARAYLPSHVVVAVRVHGTLQLIDQAEDVPPPTDERRIMYLMEQYGLLTADLVLCQTRVAQQFVSTVYGIHRNALTLAPPPMDVILGYVDRAAETVSAQDKPPAWLQSQTVLIYGRLQLVKGLETIVRAAVQLARAHRAIKSAPGDEARSPVGSEARVFPLRFRFLGTDKFAPEKAMMTSVYLQTLIPDDVRQNFEFHIDRPVDRVALAAHAGEAYAAVFASTFETFNMALHEVARMRVPVILSRIPAFTEYFDDGPALFFTPDDVASLKHALQQALDDRHWAQTIRTDGYGLHYSPATAPYTFYETGEGSALWTQRYPPRPSRSSMLAQAIDEGVATIDSAPLHSA